MFDGESGDDMHDFSAKAVSGASGENLGVAGSFALNKSFITTTAIIGAGTTAGMIDGDDPDGDVGIVTVKAESKTGSLGSAEAAQEKTGAVSSRLNPVRMLWDQRVALAEEGHVLNMAVHDAALRAIDAELAAVQARRSAAIAQREQAIAVHDTRMKKYRTEAADVAHGRVSFEAIKKVILSWWRRAKVKVPKSINLPNMMKRVVKQIQSIDHLKVIQYP